jgi:hypothetical protein
MTVAHSTVISRRLRDDPRFSRALWMPIPSHPCQLSQVVRCVERAEAFMAMESLRKEITSSNNPERARRLAWLGPPPLFEGEDAAAYDELSARIAGAMEPADIFEEIWVGDIVYCAWQVFRLRRLQASLMTATAYEGLQKVLEPLVQPYRIRLISPEPGLPAIKRPSSGSMSSSRRLASPWTQSWPRLYAPISTNSSALSE